MRVAITRVVHLRHRKNLIVPRVGRNSRHGSWLGTGEARSWDLYLCPFEPLESPPPGVDCRVGKVLPGPTCAASRPARAS